MNKKITGLWCIGLALCLVLSLALPAIAADEPAADTLAPVITHTPVQYGRYGEALSFSATVTDETAVAGVWMHWRGLGGQWTSVEMTVAENGTYTAQLSAEQMELAVVQYYLEAYDGANWTLYGSEDRPCSVIVNRGIYIASVAPGQVDIATIAAGKEATITGENFSEGMSVLLGEVECAYTLANEFGTKITVTLPELPICTADLQISKDEAHCILFNAITYIDGSSKLELDDPGPVFVGQTVQLPIRVSAACEVTDVELALRLDPNYFEEIEFVQSDANTSATASCTVSRDGLATIRISSGSALNQDSAIGYLSVKIKYTPEAVTSAVSFESAKIHSVNVDSLNCPVSIRNDISVELLNVPEGFVTLEGVLPDCTDWLLEVTYPGQEVKDRFPVTPDMIFMEDCTVRYMGVRTAFDCTQISKDLIDRIEITNAPDKTQFLRGDALDLTGMEVSLIYKDGVTLAQPISNYTVEGYDASTVGTQTLTLTCGEFTATLEVTVNPREISSDLYTVQDGYLRGISAGTTAATLLESLNDSQYIRIFREETEVTGDVNLATGMSVKLMVGETVYDSLTVVVTGDVNGDGRINVTDMLAAKKHILKHTLLDGAAVLAADYNADGKVNITDFLRIKAYILGRNLDNA